jgi:hypothetical protein
MGRGYQLVHLMVENHVQRVHTEQIVLDIGDDMGGLIFYTTPELISSEIEVAPVAAPQFKTHTDVAERLVNGRTTIYAGVFPPIAVGDYTVCCPAERQGQLFSVTSGHVTEIDWR